MWNTVLLRKYFTYLCFTVPQIFPTKVFLLRPCCGSSCSVHPTVVYVHTPKKSVSQYQPFSSNINKWKQGIYVLSTKLHDTRAYKAGKNNMIWFRPSVGGTCPCTDVHGHVPPTDGRNQIILFFPAVYASVSCSFVLSTQMPCIRFFILEENCWF
jgi:hypothetical protein